MTNPQLLDYVSQQLKAGYNEPAIRTVLQQSGYAPAMVDECFNELYNKSKPAPMEFPQAIVTPAPTIGLAEATNAVTNPNIKKRSVAAVLLLPIITFGIYFLYWLAKTKDEINSLGADIPTAWLLIVPIASYYWFYRYSESFSKLVKKDQSTPLWFLLFLFAPFVAIAMIQTELNKLA